MLFNSSAFIFGFLPSVLVAAFLLRRWLGPRAELVGITIGSLVFYSYSGLGFTLVLAVSLVINYLCAVAIRRSTGHGRTLFAGLGVGFDLLLLGYFKYFNFFLAQIDATGMLLPFHDIVLPIGISFYTFQQIAYLVDIYRGQQVEEGFGRYTLFVIFFPQLIAGPIVHHAEMMPQFERRRGISSRDLGIGLTIFAIGLGKKIFLADKLATFASPVFNRAAETTPDFASAWLATLCYTLQIYFDFSAYSDMAIGLAFLFGIRLPFNFASPYKAISVIDFWRRWHITLSRLLRDYVYISLGGNRCGAFRRHFNVFATMVIGGFWHGAGWNFVLWGAIHGAAIVVNHLWQSLKPAPRLPPFLGWALTFLVVAVAWVPFRADGMDATIAMWRAMAGLSGFELIKYPNFNVATNLLPVALAIALLAPNTQQFMRHARPGLRTAGYPSPYVVDGFWPNFTRLRWQPTPLTAVATALLLVACILSLKDVSEFIYFRF